ncbi:MAG: guanylate kinase [Candidatus Latescibacterota bacterium]
MKGRTGRKPAKKEARGRPGLLVVVSAPSGAGKTSVLKEILQRYPEIRFSVSVTTRKPRPGERHGVDYYFICDQEFDRLTAADEFIEWAVVHGCRYGTLRKTLAECVRNGETVIFDTDTVGARNIKSIFPESVLIFIAPPSPEALRIRLESRDTESPERIRMRLDAAPEEMERAREYDYIVINDTLEKAIAGVEAILTSERMRSKRVLPFLKEWRINLNGEGE